MSPSHPPELRRTGGPGGLQRVETEIETRIPESVVIQGWYLRREEVLNGRRGTGVETCGVNDD